MRKIAILVLLISIHSYFMYAQDTIPKSKIYMRLGASFFLDSHNGEKYNDTNTSSQSLNSEITIGSFITPKFGLGIKLGYLRNKSRSSTIDQTIVFVQNDNKVRAFTIGIELRKIFPLSDKFSIQLVPAIAYSTGSNQDFYKYSNFFLSSSELHSEDKTYTFEASVEAHYRIKKRSSVFLKYGNIAYSETNSILTLYADNLLYTDEMHKDGIFKQTDTGFNLNFNPQTLLVGVMFYF